jgi:hypothetical protein
MYLPFGLGFKRPFRYLWNPRFGPDFLTRLLEVVFGAVFEVGEVDSDFCGAMIVVGVEGWG